jgi:two-component system LytT family response regulator
MPSHFVRIHRSAIINVDQVREIQPWSHGDSLVILKNGSQLTMSRRFRDRLFQKP